MTDRATGASKNATRGRDRGPAGPLRVFVSYRRDDVPDATHRLVEHLEQRFGKQGVFLDVDRIPAGRPFAQVISEWVIECKVFLVIIGHNWPGTRNERGIPRIKGASDFVRLEVEAALAAGVAVIPVLIEDAPVPAVEDLPESMAALPSLQAFKLTRDHWAIDVERLERTMEAIAGIPEAHSPGGRRHPRAGLPAIAIVVVIAVVGSIAAAVALLVNPTTKPTTGTNVTKVRSPPSRRLAATTPATTTKSTNSGGPRTSASTSASSSPATDSAGSNGTISSATHGAGSNGTTTSINAANNTSDGEAATATTSPSTHPTSVSAAATLTPEQVVSRYWDDIGIHPHRFGAAYGYFDAWYKQHRESRATFIGTHKKAKIKEVKFRGKTVSKSGSKATVRVLFLLTDDAMYGCREWEGHYAMTYEGRWLINEAILEHIHRCGG
jgi:hypothetical protein